MNFELVLSEEADEALNGLRKLNYKKYKKVAKILKLMEVNLRHPSLNTHKYDDLVGSEGEVIFESYVENRTPGAYRIFWYYGPDQRMITIFLITPHP